ncbi:hypothetical protein L198_06912 [Cryptococcus wingfieldii CBS 7118]|uniref:Uncharacterized protein n=1 Tax=Cryptococcus wingfieldii CBS 7118 TaxID=1295528 RepID=A0A1E3IGN1_9TREE|nr:hypothetical protein L198_06912 [Cryptococcus wingfieldii CBS 7118]ODN87688.1 hypothetical protein L198_06912 [Cryptococcus wingfieldii CBS 7118]
MAPEHGAATHQQLLPDNDKRTSWVTQPTATTCSLPTPSQKRMAEMEETLGMNWVIFHQLYRQNTLLHLIHVGVILSLMRDSMKVGNLSAPVTISQYEGLLIRNWREITRGYMTFEGEAGTGSASFMLTMTVLVGPICILLGNTVYTVYCWVRSLAYWWDNRKAATTNRRVTGDQSKHA